MDKFAFILHPLDATYFARKFKLAKFFPDKLLEGVFRFAPPLTVAEITGIKSAWNETQGWFVACPLTARQMVELPLGFVLRKIIQTGKVAERLGAKIVGLGAFTSVVGDGGVTIARNLNIPVTTGNSYTVATALEGTYEAAKLMGIDMKKAEIAILGATGSIGSACAQILARDVKYLTLVARNERNLERLANRILHDTGLAAKVTSNTKHALRTADVVIAVTSAVDTIIDAHDLKPGAVVCDVARPHNVARQVAEVRKDVLVIEGGVVEVPGEVDFHFDFGFPPGVAYACMAETMILALERRWESFSLGRELSVARIDEIKRLAKKHGFKLAGFRSFDRPLSLEEIIRIRKNTGKIQPVSSFCGVIV